MHRDLPIFTQEAVDGFRFAMVEDDYSHLYTYFGSRELVESFRGQIYELQGADEQWARYWFPFRHSGAGTHDPILKIMLDIGLPNNGADFSFRHCTLQVDGNIFVLGRFRIDNLKVRDKV